MRLAVEVWSADGERIIATARRAEELGIDAFAYGESPTGLNLDCWTVLAALARSTERIRLGPVITNLLPDYRSPILLARQAATVAILSGGRLDLRTGVGASARYGRRWWEPAGVRYPDYDRRLADLADTLPRLRRFWAGDEVELGGPAPVRSGLRCPQIPITVAAVGRRAMALAAAEADTWEASFRTPAEYRRLAAQFDAIGPARPVARSLEIDGFIGTTPDRAATVVERARAERGRREDLDRVFERALVGPPARAAERIGQLAEAGVGQLLVALHDPTDADALEALVAARQLAAPDPGPADETTSHREGGDGSEALGPGRAGE